MSKQIAEALDRADIVERLLALAKELEVGGREAELVAGVLYTTGSALIDNELDYWTEYCGIFAMAKMYRAQVDAPAAPGGQGEGQDE